MKRSTSRTKRVTGPRKGGFLVVAMLCLLLSTVLVGAVLNLVQTQRRQILQDGLRLQADWLAESGIERAASHLRADSAYTRETWSVAAEELGRADSGAVTIRVEPVENEPRQRMIHVEAIIPSDSARAVRRTRRTTIVLFQES